MTGRQKTLRYFVSSCVVVAFAWALWGIFAPQASSSQESVECLPLPVSVETIKFVDHVMRPRAFTGTLVARRTSRLSFERGGRVVSLLVDEGDCVKEGQVLARIDVGQVETRLAAARAAVEEAQAVLQELVAGPRAEVIASSRATVSSLNADVTRLENDFQRSKELLESRSISQEKFDAVKFQKDAIVFRRDAAQRQLDELLAGTRAEKLVAQRATLDRLEAECKTLELDLEDGKLLAPFAGKIAERLLDEGTVVSPGTAAFELVDDQHLEAWVGLPPAIAADLVLGETYTATVQDKRFRMKLRSLRPSLDELTRTQNAVFEIEREATMLVPGQIVRLAVTQRINSAGVVLPTSALVPGPRGLWSVFVAKPISGGWVVEQRDVTLIESLGTRSLVTGTLADGMHVIVDGVHRVVAGQRVDALVSEGSTP